MINKDTKT